SQALQRPASPGDGSVRRGEQLDESLEGRCRRTAGEGGESLPQSLRSASAEGPPAADQVLSDPDLAGIPQEGHAGSAASGEGWRTDPVGCVSPARTGRTRRSGEGAG